MSMKYTVLLLAAGLAVVQTSLAGSISGIVKFAGDKPSPKPISEMAANSFCKDHCKEKFPLSDKFVFGKHGNDDTLANALVYVSKGFEGRKFDPPKQPVVLDQVGCVYVPHVVGVMTGQTLEIHNSDETLHNVMTRPKSNKGFNDGMPGTSRKLYKIFDKPELGIDLRCFMHPWMLGYVHVFDHPFFTVSGADGAFEIKGLPAGEYEVTVFHEYSRFTADSSKVTVQVGAEEARKIEFTYRMPPR
jgi:plastocyanin